MSEKTGQERQEEIFEDVLEAIERPVKNGKVKNTHTGYVDYPTCRSVHDIPKDLGTKESGCWIGNEPRLSLWMYILLQKRIW